MTDAREEELYQVLRKEILFDQATLSSLNPEELSSYISQRVDRLLLEHPLSLRLRRTLQRRLTDSITGLDILQPYMDDPSVTEIMVNSQQQIFIERLGKMEELNLQFSSRQHLEEVVLGLFSRANKDLSLLHPIADLRLQDGSRANAVLPPVAPDGPVLTIRKFTGIRSKAEDLVRSRTISQEALSFLKEAIQKKESVFLCGGTGAGKTTLLNALSSFIPSEERIITVEDSAELQLENQPNLVRLEARTAGSDGAGEVDMSALIRSALRMRPDRIIVGEVRGDEAYMLMHAANTGHPGTLCTGHGNSCADMLLRLANMIAGCTRLPYPAILRNLVSALTYLVEIRRLPGGRRRVMAIEKVLSCDTQQVYLEPIYRYDEGGDELVWVAATPK